MTYVVAEIGNNHCGDLDTCKALIRAAHDCGASAAKTQVRRVVDPKWPEYHPDPQHAYAPLYADHRAALELTDAEQVECADYARGLGIDYSVSVWDVDSLAVVEAIDAPWVKIPSARLTDHALVSAAVATGRPVWLSTGMSTLDEIEAAVALVTGGGVVMQCCSTYPAPADSLDIAVVRDWYESATWGTLAVGYSSHFPGLLDKVLASAVGASVVECHFTLDRTWKGTDHAASLEPEGLRRVVRDIRLIPTMFGSSAKRVHASEVPARLKLRGV